MQVLKQKRDYYRSIRFPCFTKPLTSTKSIPVSLKSNKPLKGNASFISTRCSLGREYYKMHIEVVINVPTQFHKRNKKRF